MLKDKYNRVVNYLRISVTERCNFRCQYCMPEKPFTWVPRENLLSFEEMFKFVKICIDNGVNKIRITGGEPLVRGGLDNFVALIYNYKQDVDLALTTNGFLLKDLAFKLKKSGLKRINISLDSLKKDVAQQIAQKDVLDAVLDGIDEALKVGLKVKVNCVPLEGVNDSEIIDLLEYCKSKNIAIRYIEYMENAHANVNLKGLKSSQILDIIASKYNYVAQEIDLSSPSKYYRLDDGYEFGIIEPYEDDFCTNCNRIRLTANGDIIPCLYFEDAQSIKSAIQDNDTQKALSILNDVVANKPEKNKWSIGSDDISTRAFYETGG